MQTNELIAGIPFTDEELYGTINERFAKVRRSLPAGHIAYHDPQIELTYEQLFERSERLAAALAAALGPEGRKQQQLVALYLDADWTEIAGLVGVTLAGHYYLAFDPRQGMAQPEASFLQFPIKAIVTAAHHAGVAESLARLAAEPVAIMVIDQLPQVSYTYQGPELTGKLQHSIYLTTGSTGTPRGVLRTHSARMFSVFLEASNFPLSPGDRVTLSMPVSLGMSLHSSLASLLCGASLHRRPDALGSPAALHRWLVEEKITVLQGSAGLIRSLAGLPEEFGLVESLHQIRTGGEALTHREIDRLLRFMPPGGKFGSRLASNEAGTYGLFIIESGDGWEGESNPAGKVPGLVKVSVVDENRHPLPYGEMGELVVQSPTLADGYAFEPLQTAARFQPASDGNGERLYYTGDMGRLFADGRIEFIGRRDFRVKVRGYTVELEAVEKALRKLKHVSDAAATVQVLENGNKRLVGYLVMEKGHQTSLVGAYQQLQKDLPRYMIPSFLQVIDSIPRIGIGKVDRKALPVPAPQRALLNNPYRAPGNEAELELARSWESILGLKPVGVDDNFFDLGGDSLLSMQMSLEVEKKFHQSIPPQFFKAPTIANLAHMLQTLHQEELRLEPVKEKRLTLIERVGRPTPERVWSLLRRQMEKSMLSRQYGDGLAWLFDWAARPMTQRLYTREKKLYLALWKELGRDPAGFEDSFLLALAGNIYSDALVAATERLLGKVSLQGLEHSPTLFWRSFAEIMMEPDSPRARRFMEILGRENLQEALNRGSGALLLSYHGTMTRLYNYFMPYLTGKPAGLVLAPRVVMRQELGSGEAQRDYAAVSGDKQAQYSSGVILQGYNALQNKEVVLAYIDNGYTSRGEWPAEVNGRLYMTRTGWADLAVRTRAPIVPVRASIRRDGKIEIEIFPAFTADAGADYEAGVHTYLVQFGEFLGGVFRDRPESLHWRIMQNHLEMPLAEAEKPALLINNSRHKI